ncbi:MAG TPA: nucleotidyl transferase AbiEii/AbiGii toxin family protein [Acidimicrobiales bacterium]|nr:nucleotidyl transferase AbiEii/AbiGii toxin family protein [Acidimicrobiales bacterium]
MPSPDRLTTFQRRLIEAFFSLPDAAGYVLAGGAGLLAAGISTRPTDDVDLFGVDLDQGVVPAANSFEARCVEHGWTVRTLHDSPTFRRIEIRDRDDAVLVDIAIDTPPILAVHHTEVAPTFAPREMAARKVLALFDRAAARDFADLHTLADQFDMNDLLALAAELDAGFDLTAFGVMLRSITRFTDEELAATGSDPGTLRHFAADLASRLR